jgi:hypothetical protein
MTISALSLLSNASYRFDEGNPLYSLVPVHAEVLAALVIIRPASRRTHIIPRGARRRSSMVPTKTKALGSGVVTTEP